MRCINNTDKNVTVRKQKIRKNHVREKLIFFTMLALILLLAAAFVRKLCPYDPDVQDLLMAQKPPSAEHILGTDRYGRDMFSRVLVGSTTSIYATLLLVAIITVLGTVIGIICGWCGGILDTVLMRISDLFLAFPSLVFALAVAGVLGGGIQNAIMVTSVLDIGTMMMELAGLSFLGLGVQPPMAEWGSMINDGRSMLQISPWMVLAPGLAIFITVMIFNLLGDTLRDFMDPKERAKR